MLSVFLNICGVLFICASLVFLAMTALLLIEVVFSFIPARRQSIAPNAPMPRIAVLVPAHNEALVIADTLSNIVPELSPGDRLLVVADNCTDKTGPIAKNIGAEVVYRDEPSRRGKGYALEYGLSYLSADPPDIVIIIDADCTSAPGSLRLIAQSASALHRPVQAHDDLIPPTGMTNSYLVVASFAWGMKNFVRPLGLKHLGLPCQLMGTGMAFPWELISRAKLGTSHIVEDMALGLDLTAEGAPPLFLPSARVTSSFPVSASAQKTQRARWETGHLSIILKRAPKMFLKGLRRADLGLIAIAADAAIPPLSLLVFSLLCTFLGTALFGLAGGTLVPFAITAVSCLFLSASVCLAAVKMRSCSNLIKIISLVPTYIASKLVIYAGAAAGKPIEWIRSKRD